VVAWQVWQQSVLVRQLQLFENFVSMSKMTVFNWLSMFLLTRDVAGSAGACGFPEEKETASRIVWL
jgi:hypothetical protein